MRWVKRTSIKQEVKRTSNKKKKTQVHFIGRGNKASDKNNSNEEEEEKEKKNSAKPLLQIKVEKSVKPKRACVQAPLLPSPLRVKNGRGGG